MYKNVYIQKKEKFYIIRNRKSNKISREKLNSARFLRRIKELNGLF